MRHQIKKKYSDQQEIDKKRTFTNEYRRTQKYKTGWRARWGKFKEPFSQDFEDLFSIHGTYSHHLS